ncbi:hypothetical protein K504DRAFT_457494 [Pleomassaria siparia CBS 279.74]|uniref:Uncharacterized protein n=1 Tax=Pleomassaria siparia CBS 279.74 TaxID=1314801 RepID=A0A6G1KS62_9PLEO|nr:hypothetical protein K504DRAFT_457494 [Pleomassaria siparia CBS 279.74]
MTRVDPVGETIQQAEGEIVPDTAPPPYTELSSQSHTGDPLSNSNSRPTMHTHRSAVPYPALTLTLEKEWSPADIFFWSLVQIMAVTFSADVQRLQAAMLKENPSWDSFLSEHSSSILTRHEKDAMEELCALVRDLEEKLRRRCWPTVRQQDKDILVKFVLEPAQEMQIDSGYALEVMGRYRNFEACGVRRIETLIDYWMPSYPIILPNWTSPMLDLADTLASHVSLIDSLGSGWSKGENLVLEDAMAKFRKDKGLEDVWNSKALQNEVFYSGGMCYWPLSDEYMNLAKALRTGAMRDPFAETRNRLKRQRRYCLIG